VVDLRNPHAIDSHPICTALRDNSERWRRIEALFDQAMERPDGDRAASSSTTSGDPACG